MRWTPGRRSPNVEDRRAQGGAGLGRGVGMGGGLILLVLSLLFGRNFFSDGSDIAVGTTTDGQAGTIDESPEEARLVQFVSFVLDDAQVQWHKLLPGEYRDAKLVLFRNAVQSECGVAEAAMGPFYCARDERVYIDLGFYDALRARFGAPGDFAQAYVIAHEIGHHVQNILGTLGRVHEVQDARPRSANELSVRLELQADCYAGVWGRSTGERRLLEQGDVEEGLGAAAAIGDDRIQRKSGGGVQPESFTHGTSAQRVQWFRRGLESGDPRSCDTFTS